MFHLQKLVRLPDRYLEFLFVLIYPNLSALCGSVSERTAKPHEGLETAKARFLFGEVYYVGS